MSNVLNDLSKVLIALFTLAIVAVLAGNKQTATFVGDLGKFLVAMVQKVNGTASTGGTATMGTLTATAPNGVTSSGN